MSIYLPEDEWDENAPDQTDDLECDECGEPFIPHWNPHTCDGCMVKYWNQNSDPADIAEREELEARSDGLDIPWRGEF
jgi:hypothetical protein